MHLKYQLSGRVLARHEGGHVLSAESAATVRSTLRVIAEHLDTITARFYDTMLGERPELLDGLFNRGNQASGDQRKALAGSVAVFAKARLENPDVRPDNLMSSIDHMPLYQLLPDA